MLERLVAHQLLDDLSKSGLLPRLQSACRAGNLTETAVLKVLSDVHDPARHRRRRLICTGVAGSVLGLRHGGPRHPDWATEDFLWSVWCGAAVVPGILHRPAPVGKNRILGVISDTDRVWVLGAILFLLYTVDLILLI